LGCDEGVEFLSNAFSINNKLASVNMSVNNISVKDVEYLSNALSINNTLTGIDLRDNNIGDEGVELLSKALSINNTLTCINLSENNIGDEGVEYLSNALSINNELTSINVEYNNIGDKGVGYLSNAILYNPSLIDIDGIDLTSLQCRSILGLDESFSKRSNKDILAYLKDRYWINRKEFNMFLEKTGFLYDSNEENKVSNQANHDTLSLYVHNCSYNNFRSIACYL
jgi:hypothetical protein